MTCPIRMNSQTGQKRVKQAGGFTLLEVVFVLGLIAVLVTWLTLSIGTVETEQKLRQASGDIEIMAKRARNIAVRQQRAYQLRVDEGKISISPQYPRDEESGIEIEDGEGYSARDKRFKDIVSSEETDKDVSYEIRRWGSDEWIKIEKDRSVVVIIEPTGLVEPISIRCSIGESWIKQELHPLTAGVRDEETSIKKE